MKLTSQQRVLYYVRLYPIPQHNVLFTWISLSMSQTALVLQRACNLSPRFSASKVTRFGRNGFSHCKWMNFHLRITYSMPLHPLCGFFVACLSLFASDILKILQPKPSPTLSFFLLLPCVCLHNTGCLPPLSCMKLISKSTTTHTKQLKCISLPS